MSKEQQIKKPAEEICKVMTRIYKRKLTTVSGGNISLLDDEGNMWITPSGADKGRYKAHEILMVDRGGNVCGERKPSVETIIHKTVYESDPKFKGVVHAHPPAMVAMSLLRELPQTNIMPQVATAIKQIGIAAYACPGSEALRENTEKAFRAQKGCNAVILENHGAFVASEYGVGDAFGLFEALNLSITIQAKATVFSGRKPNLITERQLKKYIDAPKFEFEALSCGEAQTRREAELRRTMCQIAKRAYDSGLLTQKVGVISVRLNEDSFLITKSDANNGDLMTDDIVKIRGKFVESGKIPSKSTCLHQKIYRENPQINGIIMASPPNAMVFAVTDEQYDLKTIPECYIVLREAISRFSFGATIEKQAELAEYFKKKSPVAIVENDCYICTGDDLFNAFDRLEVIEFSAEAVILAKELGGIVQPITMEEVAEIKDKFKIG